LLTDFGLKDHYVGALKGVMLGICPRAQLVDISHEITPYAIPEAAFTLEQAWRCFPKGTVHLVVVDPGVGSARRPILAEAGGHRFVAPDNGVLTMLYESTAKQRVREITASRYFREPVSQTFHGRDIFAPVTAHVAGGLRPSGVGGRINDYVRLDFAKPVRRGPKRWVGAVLKIDRFGNLITNFDSNTWRQLSERPFEMKIGNRSVGKLAPHYSAMAAGELFAIPGSAGFIEISMNQESAAAAAGGKTGGSVDLRLL
jgi:S-adenosyl-L-methionine hydrolase (adenosine-forming)